MSPMQVKTRRSGRSRGDIPRLLGDRHAGARRSQPHPGDQTQYLAIATRETTADIRRARHAQLHGEELRSAEGSDRRPPSTNAPTFPTSADANALDTTMSSLVRARPSEPMPHRRLTGARPDCRQLIRTGQEIIPATELAIWAPRPGNRDLSPIRAGGCQHDTARR